MPFIVASASAILTDAVGFTLLGTVNTTLHDFVPMWVEPLYVKHSIVKVPVDAEVIFGAYVAIAGVQLLLAPIPVNVSIVVEPCLILIVCVNEETYLVVSNLTGSDYTLKLSNEWTDRESGTTSDTFEIKNNTIIFLIKK